MTTNENTTDSNPIAVIADEVKPPTLIKRIGRTTYEVNIYFSKTSKETIEDKIMRLINREIDSMKW